jgi:hypothetical protein
MPDPFERAFKHSSAAFPAIDSFFAGRLAVFSPGVDDYCCLIIRTIIRTDFIDQQLFLQSAKVPPTIMVDA